MRASAKYAPGSSLLSSIRRFLPFSDDVVLASTSGSAELEMASLGAARILQAAVKEDVSLGELSQLACQFAFICLTLQLVDFLLDVFGIIAHRVTCGLNSP